MNVEERSLETGESTATRSLTACPGCGQHLAENFCPRCGEKKFDPHQLTLRHFLEQTVEVFTHFDNRFFRSFKLLVSRPGFLTTEYIRGRRKAYLQPLQLFLVANLLFFFVQTFSPLQPLTTALWVHTHEMAYHDRAWKVVQEEISRQHLTLEEYSARFDAKEPTESKTLVIVMVPCLAAALAVIYVFKSRTLVRHLVFSFHFYAFALLVLTGMGLVLAPLAFVLGNAENPLTGTQVYLPKVDLALTMILAAIIIYYLTRSLREVYASGWLTSFLLAWIMTRALFAILTLYRIFLFYVTVHALA